MWLNEYVERAKSLLPQGDISSDVFVYTEEVLIFEEWWCEYGGCVELSWWSMIASDPGDQVCIFFMSELERVRAEAWGSKVFGRVHECRR